MGETERTNLLFQETNAFTWIHFRSYGQTFDWIVRTLWLRRVPANVKVSHCRESSEIDLRISNGWWNADKGLPLPKGKCWLDADATLREAEHSLDAGAAVWACGVAFL